MPYVMVPVPEEHVLEAMEAVLRIIARADIVVWTDESFIELFNGVDEPTRAVMSTVAKAAESDKRLTDDEITSRTELGIREILQLIREVNELAKQDNHPMLVHSSTGTVTLPNGRTRDQRQFHMSAETAALVRAAEAAEHAELRSRMPSPDACASETGSEPTAAREYSDVEYVFEPNSMDVPPAREYLRDVWERRGFVAEMASANLRGTRSNTAMGELWGLADPLFQAGIYIFLVSVLRGRADASYLTLVVAGIFLFNVTSTALSGGGRSIVQGKNLMLNSTFPRAMLPIAVVYRAVLEFLPSIPIYIVLHLALRRPVGSGVLLLPLLFALQVLMSTGLAMLLAALTVYIRDMANLLTYIIRIFFFTTPIIYPADSLGPTMTAVLSLNPFFALFSGYQAIVLGGAPTTSQLIQVVFWTIVSLVVGYRVFVSLERSFALKL